METRNEMDEEESVVDRDTTIERVDMGLGSGERSPVGTPR